MLLLMKASLYWLAISVSLLAQGRVDKFEYWPGASYDPSVPTEKQVIGHDPGNRVTRPEDIVKYMEALAAARPHQMRVFDYGKTWEGRRLIYCAVSSEANIRRLDEIRGGMKQLADPRKISDADAKRIMARMPAVLWLAYGVHGNEISSNDAAMLTAYHLVASRNDKLVDEILANVLANYQFMTQLLGLAVLAKILNEQSRRPFRPRHGYGCPTLRAGRRPFCGRRVRSC
jgi:hypothetical protein